MVLGVTVFGSTYNVRLCAMGREYQQWWCVLAQTVCCGSSMTSDVVASVVDLDSPSSRSFAMYLPCRVFQRDYGWRCNLRSVPCPCHLDLCLPLGAVVWHPLCVLYHFISRTPLRCVVTLSSHEFLPRTIRIIFAL